MLNNMVDNIMITVVTLYLVIKQASLFNVFLDYFQNNFLEYVACCRQGANRT
jgi:hypothetical protein